MLIEKFKHSFNKWFIILFVAVMCAVFAFTGIFPAASNMVTGGNSVASVGGEPISVVDFQRTLGREMESFKAFGDQLPPFFLQQIQERALQGLIQQKLLLLEAKRMGIFVSSQEVMAEIQKQPYFQNEETKKFDVNKYKEILTSNGMNPGGYETLVQEDLTRMKLVQFFQSRIRITDSELQREYELAGEKRNLEYIRIRNEDAYEKMKLAEDEVKKFLADPAKKTLIDGQYNANIRKYKKDDEICARHILKRADAKAEDKNADKTSEKAPADFAKLNPTKKNFEELAKKYSDDPGSKTKGGDLGCFPKGMMDENFERVAFSLPVGKISEPVKSAFGWHYVYVYDKKPGFEKKLDQVQREIAEELIKKERFTEIQKINRETAESFAKRWASGDRKGLKFTETGLFTRVQSTIPTIGKSNEILNAAFDTNSKAQKEPQIFEAAGGIIIGKVKEKVEPDMSKFEGDKEKQFKTLQSRKLEAFFPAWMENVQARFPVKMNAQVLDRFQKASAQQ